MGRTARTFKAKKDVWPLVEAWAKANGYREVEADDDRRLYQKGGRAIAKSLVSVERDGDDVRLEAWVPADFMQRLFTFFLLPAEMEIDSNRSGLTIPRQQARTAVNKLLKQFGQREID